MSACSHTERQPCASCGASVCPTCLGSTTCGDCAYGALAGEAAAKAAKQADAKPVAPAAPAKRGPVLAALLVVWALALAWAVTQAGRTAPPPITAEALTAGAVRALVGVAEVVDAVKASGQPLPDELRGAQAVGVTYRRLDEGAYVLSAAAGPETIELEVRGGQATLRGRGTEAFTRSSGAGGGQ